MPTREEIEAEIAELRSQKAELRSQKAELRSQNAELRQGIFNFKFFKSIITNPTV